MRVRFPLGPLFRTLILLESRYFHLPIPLLKTLSIALCTYNGSQFLREQLQSLANQTLLPFEVVISDDCSTDNTLSIIQEFSNVLNIKVLTNEKPLKVIKNFENAIAHCSGDIILMCDQDDIWHPDKLAKISLYFEENPKQLAVFSDAILVDDEGKSLGKNFWSAVRFFDSQISKWKNKKSLDILLHGNRVAGCMMAIRKELIDKIIPFPTHIPDLIHDGWITIVAAMMNSIGVIEEPLIYYRQHKDQQIGTQSRAPQKRIPLFFRFSRPREEKLIPFLKKRDYFCVLKVQLEGIIDKTNPNFQKIDNIINYFDQRAKMPILRLRRLFPVLRLLFRGDYYRYKDQETSWFAVFNAALGDLFE
jgi:glycosyltransferase involved in cell wall biosynthesis